MGVYYRPRLSSWPPRTHSPCFSEVADASPAQNKVPPLIVANKWLGAYVPSQGGRQFVGMCTWPVKVSTCATMLNRTTDHSYGTEKVRFTL